MSVHPGRDVSVELVFDADRRLVIRKSAADPAARARLRHEHAVLDRFRHPGAVAVMSFTDDPESTTLTLKWAGPHTLSNVSDATIEEAAGLVAAVASTVADAHDSGIVHGRLDPWHVIINESGQPVICGWGGATFIAPGLQADGAAQPADDVASIGQLLTRLVGSGGGFEPIPERWHPFRRRKRWSGYQRRALLTLADQAVAPDAPIRPTARRLAAAIKEAVPGACPMPLRTELESMARRYADDVVPRDGQSLGSAPYVAPPPPPPTPLPTARAAWPEDSQPGPSIARSRPPAPTETQPIDPHRTPAGGVKGARSRPRDQSPAFPNGTDAIDPHRTPAGGMISAPSEPRDRPRAFPNGAESILPHRAPSAGVIGSRSDPPPADHRRKPRQRSVERGRRRLSKRWRGRHGRSRRWLPIAAVSLVAVSLVAVLTAVGIATLLHSGSSTSRSGPRRVGDAGRHVSPAASPSAPRNSTPPTTAASSAGRAVLSPSGAVHPSEPKSTATSLPSNCHPPSGAVADVDGDGCPEPVRIVGNILITPVRELAAGQQGDQVVLGDWWCRGRVTPALLRPTTGEVFVFARWPQGPADITVTPTTTVSGATGIGVDHRGSCDVIRVQRAGEGPVDVSVPRGSPG